MLNRPLLSLALHSGNICSTFNYSQAFCICPMHSVMHVSHQRTKHQQLCLLTRFSILSKLTGELSRMPIFYKAMLIFS